MRRSGFSKVWKNGCIAGSMLAGCAVARADENDQFWLTGTLNWKATDHVSFKVAEQTRFKDETQYYKQTDVGVGYAFNKSWSVGATYRFVTKKSKAGEWQDCDGYLLDLVNTTKGWGAELKSRMRLAYFDPDYDADCTTDFRPKFTLCPAKGVAGWKLKPYVADEMMYNFDEGNLYRNRLSVGLKCNPVKALSLDLSIMNEKTETNSKWAENWNTCLAATWSF